MYEFEKAFRVDAGGQTVMQVRDWWIAHCGSLRAGIRSLGFGGRPLQRGRA